MRSTAGLSAMSIAVGGVGRALQTEMDRRSLPWRIELPHNIQDAEGGDIVGLLHQGRPSAAHRRSPDAVAKGPVEPSPG